MRFVYSELVELWMELWITGYSLLISENSFLKVLKTCFLSPEYPGEFVHWTRLSELSCPQRG